ncbi:KamA family radical SAM protein [Desulforhabdus sp. TSK]|uniref:KamA family radical SAM protein n=1 Tax=Desulforhabdus sp. TSK TaxID=2925014 RepID=UPI001FC804B5|nr:KamA family radical SAM protein [Desulforhabdus sp. TSK]GKT08114.1 lysine 2,3-aminomutase [Desulforhabdus sp. TSK]
MEMLSSSLRAESSTATLENLVRDYPVEVEEIRPVAAYFPFKVNPYYASLMDSPGDPIWRQCIPDPRELQDLGGMEDPLAEELLSPVPNLVHRYPNRILWLVSQQCAVHCRFCTRKRRWREPVPLTDANVEAALEYIGKTPDVQDVLLSGGDPLLLPMKRLEALLSALRKIPHVEIIRIGSRVPCVDPRRITQEWAALLARYHPVYLNLHFNHPREITDDSRAACAILANAGIPLGSQTVLLRGVNDAPEILGALFQKLLTMRVRPYYLLQMDLTRGTSHFRTPVSVGLKIVHALRNRISGLAMPHYVIDLPGGRGKIPLTPRYVQEIKGNFIVLKDSWGRRCDYPLLEGEGEDLRGWMSG